MIFTIWLILAIATAAAALVNISNQSFNGSVNAGDTLVAIICGIFWPIWIPFVIILRLMN